MCFFGICERIWQQLLLDSRTEGGKGLCCRAKRLNLAARPVDIAFAWFESSPGQVHTAKSMPQACRGRSRSRNAASV